MDDELVLLFVEFLVKVIELIEGIFEFKEWGWRFVWILMFWFLEILFLWMKLRYLFIVFDIFDIDFEELVKELLFIGIEFLVKILGMRMIFLVVGRNGNFLGLILFLLGCMELFFL